MRLDQLDQSCCASFNQDENLQYRACRFAYDATNQVVYKYYCGPQRELYRNEFRLEFDIMQQINQEHSNSSLFPRYSGCGEFTDCGCPFIAMEYIPGDTLEQRLRTFNAPAPPAFLFTPNQLGHIIEQIYTAQDILCRHGLLYFDLSPSNIILRNPQFDICVIDFTFCYHINPDKPYADGYYKKIDDDLPNVSRECPMQIVLRQSLYRFFSRLFYPGSAQYALSYRAENFDDFRGYQGLGDFPATPYRKYIDQCYALFGDDNWHNNSAALLAPLNTLYQSIRTCLR